MSTPQVAQVAQTTVQGLHSFQQLIRDFNVVGVAIGILIGNNFTELANTLIDGALMPTISPVLQRFAGNMMTFQIGNVTLQLDKFFQALTKFIALSILIFFLMQAGTELKRPIT